LGDRQIFIGSWTAGKTITATRDDGAVLNDFEEDGMRLKFLEDGMLIRDRGFFVDTVTWFFASEPPTLIFGSYQGQSTFGTAGIFAKTFTVSDLTEDNFTMSDIDTFPDSLGRIITVEEVWEVLN
jgi:hypothetical protein